MIHISRPRGMPPELAHRAQSLTLRIIGEFQRKESQRRLQFDERMWGAAKGYLKQVFQGKCVYCETRISAVSEAHVDHFRPKSGVDEDSSHPGYYWLAYDWNNMLLACPTCDFNKRNRFPVSGRRAMLLNDSLGDEKPLLLNPCEDYPDEHLIFDLQTGCLQNKTDRGVVTIEILGLNREGLVRERKEQIDFVNRQLHSLPNSILPDGAVRAELEQIVRLDHRYVAFRREAVRQWLLALRNATGREAFNRWYTALSNSPLAELGIKLFEVYETTRPIPAPKPLVFKRDAGYIERVEIKNFKSIESLTLEFPWTRETNIGWQMFLGENGASKTSVLQAIALALAGEKIDCQSLLPEGFLRKNCGEKRPKVGSVRLWTSKRREPIELRFTSRKFTSSFSSSDTFVRAYGPSRLVKPGLERSDGESVCQIKNLFDPFFPLCDINARFRELDDESFDKVAQSLIGVLHKDSDITLKRENGNVLVVDPGKVTVPLDLLSQGQKATLGLAADIMCGIMDFRRSRTEPEAPGDFREASGIVLIDEIDAHLHPRWKMDIVSSLKEAFPYIQFIVTTHEPLCLRGLDEKEIIIMKRLRSVIVAETTNISPKGWRVDQLLTSPLFGLKSTIDPDIDAEFVEYYYLLGQPEKELSEVQTRRLAELRKAVQRHNRLGYTRRDQMLYETIDQFLAKEQVLSSPDQKIELMDKTKQRLRDIWDRVALYEENKNDSR